MYVTAAYGGILSLADVVVREPEFNAHADSAFLLLLLHPTFLVQISVGATKVNSSDPS